MASTLHRSLRTTLTSAISRSRSSGIGRSSSFSPAVSSVVFSAGASSVTENASSTSPPVPAVTVAQSGSNAKATIVKFLQNIGSKREVEQYLKYYASAETPQFAVVKIGGAVLEDEIDVLAESLSFMAEVGLLPIVLHGGGPQLNKMLELQGIRSDYHGGIRVTTPEILRTARRVFLEANTKLVKALEERGTRARPVVGGVFVSDYLDKNKFQFVGEVKHVNLAPIYAAVELGQVPVLTCMGETEFGQLLNVNADVAGQQLSRALKPVKVIYLSGKGGMFDEHGQLMSQVDLNVDYDRLMTQPWFKHGDRLKLKEIKTLLDGLPLTSTVAITTAADLPKDLFTRRGAGTLVRRSERINAFDSLESVDLARMRRLIESSFGGRLTDDFDRAILPKTHRCIISESYRALALVTKDEPDSIPYLDKFAVARLFQGEGTGNELWTILKRECPKLYWRSKNTNNINPWYFERADGAFKQGIWTVFWYGIDSLDVVNTCIKNALAKPHTIDRSVPVHHTSADEDTGEDSYEDLSSLNMASNRSPLFSTPLRRSISNSRTGETHRGLHTMRTLSTNRVTQARVGLIGARGHTGSELIKIIDQHPNLTLSVASSRALKGKTVGEVFKNSVGTDKFRSLQFIDLQAEDIGNRSDVDVWILALPNDLAKPFVEALNASSSKAKVVDLSADYRFNHAWAYGLPERKGARSKIVTATRVANPGCYATGAQLSLFPIAHLLDSSYAPTVFGVSGYSGAGTTPSRKNDINEVRDNLMPYSLVNHMHEREISAQLANEIAGGVRFMPHVASWFQGIQLTTSVLLKEPSNKGHIAQIFKEYYGGEKLVHVTDEIPEVRANSHKHHAVVGGFTLHPDNKRLVICATIDNLLKGAATQCIQNVNLIHNFDEYAGIPLE